MLRKTKIVCTVGREPNSRLLTTVEKFVNSGMNVARINMAHYDLNKAKDKQYLKNLIQTIRAVARKKKKMVAILGDIPGPKMRIAEFLGLFVNKKQIKLDEGNEFTITTRHSLKKHGAGACITCEGPINFFDDLKVNTKDKDKPIEFWFADGAVILEAEYSQLTNIEIPCRVKVSGKIKRGQGISFKNTRLSPREYKPTDYPRGAACIDFLLLEGIEFLALSFVNGPDDVRNLQQYIHTKIAELNLRNNYHIDPFPVIAKIETEEGYRNRGEIINAAYGIMVARGDLALQTTIKDIPIYQKTIIRDCILHGKPVITATQMLSGMMNFIEPKRAEATDVSNAIFDGSDALMLSEETADPDSKYKWQAITMMSNISLVTEKDIKERDELEYQYKIDQLHKRISLELSQKEKSLRLKLEHKEISDDEFRNRTSKLREEENAEHISYLACKTAAELNCTAIIVLTETGGTARMISRFKPDMNIIAGVYTRGIARILNLSHGVTAVKIVKDRDTFPIGELQQVRKKAQRAKLIKPGDRVILAAGYPYDKPGTLTFINIYTVHNLS